MNEKFRKEIEREIKGKKIMITGGTGSFGSYIVPELLKFDPAEIVIYSRDEDKQYHMRLKYPKNPIRFVIGDVRDFERLLQVTKKINIIYHAAALKHVPYCEFHPYEAIKTNTLGAHNIKMAATMNNVEKAIAISTDKAVKPVNAMGMSKALQEKIFTSDEETDAGSLKSACVRYGNVIGSRGSVIPFFKEKIIRNEPLPITDREMTRFLITLEQAIGLVFYATVNMQGDEIFVRKLPACKMTVLAEVMAEVLTGRKDYPIVETGIREGEKIHECLVSEDEMRRVEETEQYFIVHPYGRLSKPKLLTATKEYTTQTTKLLNKKEVADLLKQTRWI
jgi:FlaA1/EpsC-like NDP-sugar epimerase